MTPRPLLLLEINEIPWRLIDRFKSEPGLAHVERFFSRASTYTTETVDSGELSPWVTWPSFHRGMGNAQHGVRDLGQDVSTFKGVPIWEEYRRRSLSIGVCGSLQSWPPIDPGLGGFYVPDTFSHDARCIPSWIEPFQRFNLNQVRANGRTIDNKWAGLRDLPALVWSLPKLGIRPETMAAIAKQLVDERLDPKKTARRPVFQGMLFWDLFRSLYHPKTPPAFATFFTNHVASIMHRYWHQTFPGDFGARYAGAPRPHLDTMRFALELVDRILGDALAFQEACPSLVLVFATSMGQDAVLREEHEGVELWIRDLERFLAAFGAAKDEHRPLLAMVPQIVAEIDRPDRRASIKRAIESATTASGRPIFSVRETGATLSITLITPRKTDIDAGGFFAAPGVFSTWDRAGIVVGEVDPGTGYHIPEGIMAVVGESILASDARTRILASEAKAFLMELGGLSARPAPSERPPAGSGEAGARAQL